MARLLETGDPSATVNRLFQSRHVEDLQLIVAVALLAVMLAFAVGLSLAVENQIQSQWQDIAARHSGWIFLHVAFAALGSFLAFFGPVLAVFGGLLAWAYQAGSARLGVVDLFACEIDTICRVATVVDSVRQYVKRFHHGLPSDPSKPSEPALQFTSQENYFPVFEGNTSDLQTLEARVVINITAFYSYMKAVRDSLRALADAGPQPAEQQSLPHSGPAAGSWYETARNVIYVMFLGLESARHATADLVEFEPERAERTLVILISELEAYGFLRSQFTDEEDARYQRIKLREAAYRDMMPKLHASVEAGRASEVAREPETDSHGLRTASQWEPAVLLLPECWKRYEAALGLMKAATA